jgi:dihydrofolate reductase
MNRTLTLIVATDRNNGIGVNNTLPWRLPEDLAFFKRITSGHVIIMGRKTFDAIGRPLPNRRNIVVTRNPAWVHAGVETTNSLDQAVAIAGEGEGEVFIIGGAQIYRDAISLADRLIVTEIDAEFACDAFFPPVDPAQWQLESRETHHSESNGWDYSFVMYRRR